MSFREIGVLTKINQITCRAVYRSYYVNGCTAVKPRSPGRPASPLPEDVKDYLINNLYDNRFLSLRERVKDIQAKYGFYINYDRLRKFYKRSGIKYQRCKTQMLASMKNIPSRRRDRYDFAAKLVTLMKRDSFVWVADESSCSLWNKSRIKYTWMVG